MRGAERFRIGDYDCWTLADGELTYRMDHAAARGQAARGDHCPLYSGACRYRIDANSDRHGRGRTRPQHGKAAGESGCDGLLTGRYPCGGPFPRASGPYRGSAAFPECGGGHDAGRSTSSGCPPRLRPSWRPARSTASGGWRLRWRPPFGWPGRRERPPAPARPAGGNRGGRTGVSRAGPHTRACRRAGFFGKAATALRGRRTGSFGSIRTSGLGLCLRSVSRGNGAHAKAVAGSGGGRPVSFRGLSPAGRAGRGRGAAGSVRWESAVAAGMNA